MGRTFQPRGVAVISGGGTGIGREVALELGRRGFDLALLGRREEPLRQTLEDSGASGLSLVCDVRDIAAVARASDQIHQRWEAAEVVVPAAGVAHIAPLDALASEAFAETVDVNLTGAALLIRALLPAMKQRGRGWIVPILSVAARRGFPGWSAYCASKWGLAGLVAALREELSGSGVRITALYPGATDTPIWDTAPGEWNRAAMIPAREVARALGFALDSDPSTLVEEIHLGPAGGAL
ncbi:MAG TPA: SDR family NAD(P)-dependent oxidoreductase [Thermoanaerobaculia bacterium]|jgi:NADP-dependent 3-hydroxy acid dehydrogenase YdfG|nr:SDR family NAD(P)-dependent oxidoreductase [Thermoanaerobaculia bacterium]